MTAPEPADLARKERECRDSDAEWLLMIPEPPMNKPHDQWNSRDIAQFGRMSMHVDVYDAEPPKPATVTAWQFVMAALCAILVALIIATVTAQIVMSADVYGLVR